MKRLAVAIGNEAVKAGGVLNRPVDAALEARLHQQLGKTLLLYRVPSAQTVQFIGVAHAVALRRPLGAGSIAAEFQLVRQFEVPVLDWEAAHLPGSMDRLELGEERFIEIIEQGSDARSIRLVAEEMGQGFEGVPAIDGPHPEISNAVVLDYASACAFTGHPFGPHALPEVMPLWPLETGGPRQSRNFLPMLAEVADEWRRGHLTLSDELGFIVDKWRIAPEVEELLRPSGKLAPSQSGTTPDPACVAFHRDRIFGR